MVPGRQAERPREAQAAAAGVVHQAVSLHRVACPAVLAGGAEAGVGGLALLAREGPAAAVADTRGVSARPPASPPPALPSMGVPPGQWPPQRARGGSGARVRVVAQYHQGAECL